MTILHQVKTSYHVPKQIYQLQIGFPTGNCNKRYINTIVDYTVSYWIVCCLFPKLNWTSHLLKFQPVVAIYSYLWNLLLRASCKLLLDPDVKTSPACSGWFRLCFEIPADRSWTAWIQSHHMMSRAGSQKVRLTRVLDSRFRSRIQPHATGLERDSVRFSFSLAFCCDPFTRQRRQIHCLLVLLEEGK